MGEGGALTPVTPETARLLAEAAVNHPSTEESAEARLMRLSCDPAALFAALNLGGVKEARPSCKLDHSRGEMAAALIANAPASPPRRAKGRRKVIDPLKTMAPAIASHTHREEHAAPFRPSADDIREAIDANKLVRFHPALMLAAAAATAFVFWLIV